MGELIAAPALSSDEWCFSANANADGLGGNDDDIFVQDRRDSGVAEPVLAQPKTRGNQTNVGAFYS